MLIDPLVWAGGGNLDPTSTRGKGLARAKALELAGWDHPRPLAGRAFAVVVHGDTAGTDEVRRSLCGGLPDLRRVDAVRAGALDWMIGYYEPYTSSRAAYERDIVVGDEVQNTAAALATRIAALRAGEKAPDECPVDPRPK